LLIASTVSAGALQIKEETIAGIPIKVIHETRSTFGTQFVETVIPDELYSRKNIESVWRYFCEKYTDKKTRLDVRVYTNRSYEFNRQFEHTLEGIRTSGRRGKLRDPEASFERMGDGALAPGGDNELLIYSPNIDEPEKKERVVLAGKDPYRPRSD
jgi:hypothetical protein